ncbi:MAG: CcmD family protein [Sphingobacteriaceae bacterium]|nr:CcmD family protein [Sphingobacteriaceae bacterium]
MKKLLSFFVLILITLRVSSQEIEMATGLRSSGKIYVVISVIAVIFIGLVFYLFTIDRRVKKLENKE